MTVYSGDKSLDAEIHLDLVNGSIEMDYSLNKKGSIYDSNHSVKIKDDFGELPKNKKIKEFFKRLPIFYLALSYTVFVCPILTYLLHHNIIRNKNYQVEHQRILKWLYSSVEGTRKIIINSPLESAKVVCPIRTNIWVGYELEGEFQQEIKKISLKRHFETIMRFGGYEQEKQNGWELVLEFHHPPQSGRGIIEYI